MVTYNRVAASINRSGHPIANGSVEECASMTRAKYGVSFPWRRPHALSGKGTPSPSMPLIGHHDAAGADTSATTSRANYSTTRPPVETTGKVKVPMQVRRRGFFSTGEDSLTRSGQCGCSKRVVRLAAAAGHVTACREVGRARERRSTKRSRRLLPRPAARWIYASL